MRSRVRRGGGRKSNPRGAGFRKSGPRIRKGPLRSAIKNVVKSVLNRSSETKVAAFYGNADPHGGTGQFGNYSVIPHNGNISSNQFDIQRILPLIDQGLDNKDRIGTKINPVSCHLSMRVSLPNNWTSLSPTIGNIAVVVYVLEHKVARSYDELYSANNFLQMLDVGQGATYNFNGQYIHSQLPVAKQYYKLLAKKTVILRTDGGYYGQAGGVSPNIVSNTNSAPFAANLNFNLTKHLPKTFVYPEEADTSSTRTDPKNCNMFFCVGYYQLDMSQNPMIEPPPTPPALLAALNVQYMCQMSYKDI